MYSLPEQWGAEVKEYIEPRYRLPAPPPKQDFSDDEFPEVVDKVLRRCETL